MARRVLYLTRHGETDWNVAGRWQGHTDIPLNSRGHAQAGAIAEALARVGLVAVVSSDLSRAYDTARIVTERLGLPLPHRDAGLRERAFGPFEGLTRAECERMHPVLWRAWLDEQRAPEGAEGRGVVAARMVAAMGRVAAGLARDDAPALIVTHGGALRAAVSTVGVMPPPIRNGAIWRIEWENGMVSAEAIDDDLASQK